MSSTPNLRRRAKPETNPERSVRSAELTSTTPSHAEPGKPNPYPHRLSVDVDAATYQALRLIAAQEGCRLIDLAREGIAHVIQTRE